MRIMIRDRHKLLSTKEKEFARRCGHFAFGRFADMVDVAEISVEDVNGPKGGIDKQCTFRLRGPRIADIVVTGKDEEWMRLISRTSDRCAFALRRSVDRHHRPAWRKHSRRAPRGELLEQLA